MTEGDPKSASGLLATEALKVVPQQDKELAGHRLGGVLRNLTAAAEDVTLWIRLAAAIPRGAVQLVGRVASAWRRTPAHRRQIPPPELLLAIAPRYAGAEQDLRDRYDRLLNAATDSDSAATVHPAFAGILGQMTPLDVRLLEGVRLGGYFKDVESFARSLGLEIDEDDRDDDIGGVGLVDVSFTNLKRLGLLNSSEGPRIQPPEADTGELRDRLARSQNQIHIADVRMLDYEREGSTEQVKVSWSFTYGLTAFAHDFLAIVGRPT